MAGCSIVFLMMAWPFFLVVGVLYVALEAAATVVTSPAFPWLVISVVLTTVGSIWAAVKAWNYWKNREIETHTVKDFVPILVLYAIAFITFCIAVWFAGVAILGMYNSQT